MKLRNVKEKKDYIWNIINQHKSIKQFKITRTIYKPKLFIKSDDKILLKSFKPMDNKFLYQVSFLLS